MSVWFFFSNGNDENHRALIICNRVTDKYIHIQLHRVHLTTDGNLHRLDLEIVENLVTYE